MRRTLSLERETLAEITAGELAGVAGGRIIPEVSCPATACVRSEIIGPLPTLPVDRCVQPPTIPPRCHTAPVYC